METSYRQIEREEQKRLENLGGSEPHVQNFYKLLKVASLPANQNLIIKNFNIIILKWHPQFKVWSI